MKRIITLLASAVVASAAALAVYADSPFSELRSQPDVTRVFISKAMMRMGMQQVGSMSDLQDNLPFGPGTKLDDMEIYTCESAASAARAKSIFNDYLKDNGKFEELLTVDEADQRTAICGIPGDEEGFYKTLLIFTTEKDESTVILINGRIELSTQEDEES